MREENRRLLCDTPRTDEVWATMGDKVYKLRKVSEALERDLARLTEENGALRKDVERYRRKREIDLDRMRTSVAHEQVPAEIRKLILETWIASYDAAIDAAIKEGS